MAPKGDADAAPSADCPGSGADAPIIACCFVMAESPVPALFTNKDETPLVIEFIAE